jgi:hypothetical protein
VNVLFGLGWEVKCQGRQLKRFLGYSLRPSHWQPVIFASYLDPNSQCMQKTIEGVGPY